MFKKLLASVLCMTMILAFVPKQVYSSGENVNPSRAELEKKIEEVARKRGIPSVILKSIARVESVYKQFNSDGSVFTGRGGSIGLMQIVNRYGWFDDTRLKYDIDYNIEAGADVLLRKWDTALKTIPQIGDMNPNVLENWYFAIWAYNGWSKSNNPNTGLKKNAYQDLIYYIAEKEYKQIINPIPKELLPNSGLPSKETKFQTPEDFHYGDILTYYEGDIVKLDGRQTMILKDEPSGSNTHEVNNLMELQILQEPVLSNGYFWYKVRAIETEQEGWLVGNWISKTGSIYPFFDISNTWAKDYIIKLYEMEIVTGSGDNFNPNNYITRQEMSILISKAFQLQAPDYELECTDKDSIKEWATDHVKAILDLDIMALDNETNEFKPDEYMTREEAAIIVSKIIGYDEDYDLELEYIDTEEISEESMRAIANVQSQGIMSGANGKFRPTDHLTRGEACKLISDLLDMMHKQH